MKDNVFLAFAELGEQIAETFNIKENMRAFIGWLQTLTAELKKPREEQEGFARALTEVVQGLKTTFGIVGAIFDGITDSIAAVYKAYEFVSTAGGIFGDGGAAAADGPPSAVPSAVPSAAAAVPSLFGMSVDSGGGGAGGKANIIS